MNGRFLRYVLAAAMLSLLVAGAAQAACEWSDRISMDDAECLSGGWENRSWPKKDTAWVKSECSSLGTVVAKVDREGAPDWTKWLKGDGTVNMSGSQGNVRGIHCCSDLSDLCNKSDVVNPEGCADQFEKSFAGGQTFNYTVNVCTLNSATADAANETCTINATCRYQRPNDLGQPEDASKVSSLTVPYPEVRDMHFCRGNLVRNLAGAC